MAASQILNRVQLAALNKIGNIICPAHREEKLPSFQELGVVEHVDILLVEIPPADLADLKLLLSLLGLLPEFMLSWLLSALEKGRDLNGAVGTLVRTVRFGLRGIIFSLYYSGLKGSAAETVLTPVDRIGYKVTHRPGSK